MTREEEQAIISRVLSGDYNAFEHLVLENQDRVYNLALRLVGNAEDAYDMSQEAFIRAYNSLHNFRGDSRFHVWLYRLTSNVCIDFLRKRKRRPSSSLTYIGEDMEAEELEIPDLRYNPESEAERRELRAELEEGLMSLSEDYRQILVLREINGLSYDEIAQTLDLEPGTVKSRIFRARKKLCAFMSGGGNLSGSYPSNNQKGV